MSAMSEPLLIVRRDAVLELTLNRPECRNALSRELIARLTAALRAAESDAAVRSVILTGTPPAFCAGLDLGEVSESGRCGETHDVSDLLELFETLDGLRKPVVGAVNGAAAAGGAALVTLCDVAVCGASARLGYPGVRRGLVAPIVMPYLLRAVGARWAGYLLLTGEMIATERAAACGLVHEVVPDEQVLSCARERAAMLAEYPAEVVGETKLLLRRLYESCTPEDGEEFRQRAARVRLTSGMGVGPNELPGGDDA